jgi:two-component system LytT family response regulator
MAEQLRVALVDDELVARRRLARLVEAQHDVELVGSYASARELLAALPTLQADVVLLDIQMPELTGLEASALIDAQGGPYVIFVTAHSEHALEAFERGALDYLLKPLDEVRLGRALARVRRARGGAVAAPTSAPERLALSTHRGVLMLDPASIDHAAYDGQLVTLRVGDRDLVCDWSLAELEARVPDAALLRVHRRYLLNLRAVDRLEPLADGGYIAHTKAGAQVPIARQAARALRRRLDL